MRTSALDLADPNRRAPGRRHEPCRRAFRLAALAGALFTVAPAPAPAQDGGAARPNILWITAEDMSPVLGCYGDARARTPHIDRLARESVRYTRAFATAPVCSPSRSTLITGCYAPSLGTQQMRSAFPLPADMRGFPALLRQAGYYTTNNVKTDYNTSSWESVVGASWDESSADAHWRRTRDAGGADGDGDGAGRPFFSVFNLMTTHQSRAMVWPRGRFVSEVQSGLSAGEIHDPAGAPVPPYYPDTPLVRETVARFYDCVTVMDKQVGGILKELEEDGLADDTIVFFFSDHGSGLPRHKRALFDSGMHVPLLVRFPKKFEHLAPAGPGETVNRLVSFVDFGPSVLSLAGVAAPAPMQGRAFLGRRARPVRTVLHGHRDRIDEVRDLARSARDARYLYIRNYMPHLGYNQPTAWPDQGAVKAEFYRESKRDEMSAAQWQFASPARPVEELYDTSADPLNLKNLAGSALPEHRAALARLRAAHRRHLRETRDLGFLPESEAWKVFAGAAPWDAAAGGALDAELEALYAAAAQVGVAGEPEFLANLKSPRAGVRYWGVIGLAVRGNGLSPQATERLTSALSDPSAAVRIEAANALARSGSPGAGAALPVLESALADEDLNVVLHAARTVELLGDAARPLAPAMRRADARARAIGAATAEGQATFVQVGDQDLSMFIGFSTGAFLKGR